MSPDHIFRATQSPFLSLPTPPLPSLTYPSTNDVKDMIVELQEETTAAGVVIDFTKVQHMDYTGAAGLRDLVGDLEEDGAVIYAANVLPHVELVMQRAKVLHRLTLCSSVTSAITAAHADVVEKGSRRAAAVGESNDPTQRLLGNMPPSDYSAVN